MSRDSFLAGVHRSLAFVDDDRTLRRAVVEQVRRAVPFDAFAWLLTDPDTTVGTAPLAEVPCLGQLPRLVALRYTSGRRWTSADPDVPHRPVRAGSELDRFLAGYGTYDVVSIVFADRFGWWGFLDLWRANGRFGAQDFELLELLPQPVTTALRASRAATFVVPDGVRQRRSGQAVLLLGPDLSVRQQTTEVDADLRALLPTEQSRQPIPAAAYNVAAQLLAVEAEIDAHRPLARVAVAPGEWTCVQAARLGEDIAVTIGPVEQRERWNLFCRTHALTDRETDVVTYLAEGDDTRALAARLHLSEHTIQDHLKSAFAKTGVHSRRELVARARGTEARGALAWHRQALSMEGIMGERHSIDTTVGRLAVRVVGDGPVAVLWPSLFLDERSWDRLLPTVTMDRRLVIINGPGHGASGDPGRRYTLQDCATAAGQVLDRLAIGGAVDWVGNAWGGHVGLRFATDRPAQCRRLITLGAPVAALSRTERRRTSLLLLVYAVLGPIEPVLAGVAEALLSAHTRASDPEAVELVRDSVRHADRRMLRHAVTSISLGREDLTELLPEIAVPTLMITGSDHSGFTPAQVEAAARLVPDGRAAVVPDAAYLVPFEAPTVTSTLIREFWQC